MRKLATGLLWVAASGMMACNHDQLTVVNKDQPDVTRALATPAAIENLIGGVYAQIHNGLHGSSTALDPSLRVMALESYGTVANFGMQVRSAIPRGAITNVRNYVTSSENQRDFSQMERRARDAATGIIALDKLIKDGGTLEQKGATPTGRNQRARAFGFFANGLALGYLAMSYDSGAVVTPATPVPQTIDQVPPLSAYGAIMDTAQMLLDTAQTLASTMQGSIPASWTGTVDLNSAAFVRLIRSYKARLRAGVARTPTERAAADWTKIIADAEAGITADVVINTTSNSFNIAFLGSQMFADDSRGWHQMSLMYYGMADTSGAYTTFITAAASAKAPFLVKTPDRRFPVGETRANQQVQANAAWVYNAYPYIRNRTGQDTPGEAFGTSWYDFYRFKAINLNANSGPWVEMSKVEIDMLAAEGYIRKGNFAAAATLIDKSRTRANLPPVVGNVPDNATPVPGATYTATTFRYDTAKTSNGTPVSPLKVDTVATAHALSATVPGKANCVPRVPSGGSTACGNLFEAMKYEKRMESAFTGYGQWFFDSRGWGDLVQDTAYEMPVPWQEMDARTRPFYGLGGAAGKSAAAKGTYGF